MGVQRLVLDTITEDDYELIAIHCSIASYRLAFLLNKNLGLQLFRKKEDIIFKYDSHTANFPLFQYQDHFQYNTYSLFGNQFITKVDDSVSATISQGLFAETSEERFTTNQIIPELKKVDYFLKIESETHQFFSKSIVSNLLTIPQIVTAYVVDYTQLKSKNNLIFE